MHLEGEGFNTREEVDDKLWIELNAKQIKGLQFVSFRNNYDELKKIFKAWVGLKENLKVNFESLEKEYHFLIK